MRTPELSHYRHIRRTNVSNPFPGGTTGKLASGATGYFEIGGTDDGITAVQISWYDATSSATITWQTSNKAFPDATGTSTTAGDWATEPDVITGPVGAAAGSYMFHITSNAAKRNRLKIVAAADCELEIIGSGIH